MNRGSIPRQSFSLRARGLALTTSALVVLTMFCLKFGEMTRSAWRSVLAPGPASPDQSLVAICGSFALGLTLWLLGALAVSLLAALGSTTSMLGRATARGAQILAPMILRNAVAALLGVAIIASPAAADTAHPSAVRSPRPVATQSLQARGADQELSPSWVPGGPQSTPTPAHSQIPADLSLLPGWLPSRPATPANSRALLVDSPAPNATAARRVQVDVDDEIVVHRGDTLWDIAARHLGAQATYGEIALEWPHWFTANRAVIGNDPDRLVPGERLRAPDHGRTGRQRQGGAPQPRTLHAVKGGVKNGSAR